MELEVGMYVRLNSGHIDKIIQVNDFWESDESGGCPPHAVGKRCHWIFEDMYKKASHNVINLIEKNDFVNGTKVIYTNDDYVFVLSDKGDTIKIGNDKEIKSIVTKEQFEQMQYKVGE